MAIGACDVGPCWAPGPVGPTHLWGPVGPIHLWGPCMLPCWTLLGLFICWALLGPGPCWGHSFVEARTLDGLELLDKSRANELPLQSLDYNNHLEEIYRKYICI